MSDIPYDLVARRAKAELRKRLRGLRNTHPESACAARSAKIVARLLDLDGMADAKRVALFWPIVEKREIDLRPLDAELRSRGKEIAYPAIDQETNVMTFRFATEKDLEERGLGFAEPPESATEADALDLIVVPALAADARGHRLGYGAGYYDRTLPRFAPPAITAIVVYDFQLLAEMPKLENDVACDWVVTDARTLRAER